MGCTKETDLSDLSASQQTNPGSSQNNQDHSGDPVNVVTGAFTLDEQDLIFPTQRLVIELTRHYDSQQHNQTKEVGPFGWGWTHSLNLYIEHGPQENQYTYVDDRGSRIIFSLDITSGTFVSPPGASGLELRRTGGGGFRLRQVDGLIAEFNAAGKITAMIRPGPAADSRIEFTYDDAGHLYQAAGAGGRRIRFHYQGKIPLVRAVVDHTGREWRYTYDKYQNLIKVSDPAGRVRRYRYGYSKVHVTIVETGDGGQPEARIVPREVRGLRQVFQFAVEGDDASPVAEVTNQYTSDYRVHQQTDALGNVTRFDYNRFTRMTYLTDPAGWTTVYCYDKAGNTTKVRTPEGGTTEYNYDERGNLLAEIDPMGHRTEYVELKDPTLFHRESEFGRRALGNRSEYVTIPGEEIAVGYDERGNRPMMRDALGNTYRYLDYTDFGKARRIILPTGDEIHLEYDDRSGLPLRMEQKLTADRSEPLRWIQEWTYDPWGNVTGHAEWTESTKGDVGAKRVTKQIYDEHGHHPIRRLAWIEHGKGQETLPKEEEFGWNDLGLLKAHRILRRTFADASPEMLVTQFGYDRLGRLIWEIAPDGTAHCQQLDPEERVVESFMVENATSEKLAHIPERQRQMRHRWSYDLLGREIAHIDPAGATTTREWDKCGLCTRIVEPTGFTTCYEYDRDGRETLRRTSTGYEIQTQYDAAGRMIAQRDSAGLETHWKYDALGRVVEVVQRDEDTTVGTSYAYDELGRLVEARYTDGTYERLVHDERDNLVRRERGPTPVSIEIYVYDGLGRLEKIKAGAEDDTRTQLTFQYADAQRLVETYDALGNVSRVFHDSEGNVVRKVDAEGRELRLEYDEKGRLTRKQAPDGSVDASLEYDCADRLVMAREGPILYCWDYDDAGRVIRHHQKLGQDTKTVSYQFDQAGRLVQKQAGKHWRMTYHYTPGSPFASQIELSGRAIDIVTDAEGRVIEERWDDGGRTCYTYQSDGVLTALESFDQRGRLIFGQRFAHDARRRPATEVRRYANRATHYRYHYDSLDRLECVECEADSIFKEFRRYIFDGLDNRLAEHRNGAPHQTYRYDPSNRLIEIRDAQGHVEICEYDRCGNLVRQGQRRFTYDADQRLRGVFSQGSTELLAQYHYSATDQRALVVRPDGVERIIYDDLQEILSESPTGQRTAFWGFQLDTLLAIFSSTVSKPQRVLTNTLGSVVSVGEMQQFFDYDPFGNALGGRPASPFGFAGKRFDTESGLYNNRARYFDPISGRFTQPDPLGAIDSPNLYLYARNNPTTHTDPSGWESRKSGRGVIAVSQHYGPLDKYGRPTYARATLVKGPKMRGGKATITPPGYVKGVLHERGHLIARKFGGFNDPRNIATQTRWANRTAMKRAEMLATKLANEGHRVDYEVRVMYHGKMELPLGFQVSISTDRGFTRQYEPFYNA